MTNLSDLARSALDTLKRALGIRSPSEVWIDESKRKREYVAPIVVPWYTAHHARDQWRDDELKRDARLVRRAYRRADRKMGK